MEVDPLNTAPDLSIQRGQPEAAGLWYRSLAVQFPPACIGGEIKTGFARTSGETVVTIVS